MHATHEVFNQPRPRVGGNLFSGNAALRGMTEKQGGSDVRANTTQAAQYGRDAWGERYLLTGHK